MHLVWFREDLRVRDNPALAAAAASGAEVLCVYIYDTKAVRPLGAASRWWLHHALASLATDLEQIGGTLVIQSGDPQLVLPKLAQEYGATVVHIHNRYDGYGKEVDDTLVEVLNEVGVTLSTHTGSLLHEPHEIKNQSGTPFKVFTPFKNAIFALPKREVVVAPSRLIAPAVQESHTLEALDLLPRLPWAEGFGAVWPAPTEAGAQKRLQEFFDESVAEYKAHRDIPSLASATSRLSPYLRFGQISPIDIWHQAVAYDKAQRGVSEGARHFLSEVCWREFSYHLLAQKPDIATEPLKEEFARYPWNTNQILLAAWKRGQTGVPIVDAGMRELWATGYMHNRVRMIVASYLIKNLNISWQEGEQWFWDTLLDADPANNAASWQWVAGCGMDAAPFFRIFNPVTQSEKFDPEGIYIKKWVPELAHLAPSDLFAPWTAGPISLEAAGIQLGVTYPYPLVDLKESREQALSAYKQLRG